MDTQHPFLLSQWSITGRIPRGGFGENFGLAFGGDRSLGRVNILEALGVVTRDYGFGLNFGNKFSSSTYNNWQLLWRQNNRITIGDFLPAANAGSLTEATLPSTKYTTTYNGAEPNLSMNSWVPYSMQLLSTRTFRAIPVED